MVPNFLGIGAQKSGTTWLHTMLSSHPDIWLPHVKELHYFDRRFAVIDEQIAAKDSSELGKRRSILGKRIARISLRTIRERLRVTRWRDITWEIRYVAGAWDDEWYVSLFRGHDKKIVGEVTPAYLGLGEQGVRHVAKLLPAVKLIVLLRDPVDRAWSQAKMDLAKKRGRDVTMVTEQDYLKHFLSHTSRVRGAYVQSLDRWLAHFRREQLFIGYYDEIVDDPTGLMSRVLAFLGVGSAASILPGTARQKVNQGQDVDISLGLKKQLTGFYIEDVRELARRFGGYPKQWLCRYEETLA